MPEIQTYSDYRDFILACITEQKLNKTNFSYQHVANRLGTTKSYLKLVVDKKRQMSLNKVIPLCEYFKLSDFERQYFIFLYMKNTVKNAEIREFFNSILHSYLAFNRIKSHIQPSISQKASQTYVFRNWIVMAILSLARFGNYRHEAEWIQSKLGGPDIISLDEIKLAMAQVEKEKSIVSTAKGWARSEEVFVSPVNPSDIEDNQRFKIGLGRAATAIDWKGKSGLHRPNRFQMYAIDLAEPEVKELINLCDEFEEKIVALAKKTKNPQKVMFISNNVFSISQ